MKHPFVWLAAGRRGSVLASLVFVCVVLMIALSVIGNGLTMKAQGVACGVYNIELPWSPERAASVVAAWRDGKQLGAAIEQTRLDFLFLMIYPATLSLACVVSSGRCFGTIATVGIVLSWAVLLCTPLDFIENILILKMLGGDVQAPVPQLTSYVALAKLFLGGSAVVYLVFANILKKRHR